MLYPVAATRIGDVRRVGGLAALVLFHCVKVHPSGVLSLGAGHTRHGVALSCEGLVHHVGSGLVGSYKLGQGIDGSRQYLKENPKISETILKEIRTKLKEI